MNAELKASTPSDTEIRLERFFNAPRPLVYDAFTQPHLLKRWFGPQGWTLTTCEIDLRVGGAWRFILTGPDGATMGMSGTWQALNPPFGSTHIERFDDYPGESVVTSVLTDVDGGTLMTATIQYPSQMVRDIVLQSGMTKGAGESYDRLQQTLSTEDTRA
ncbi:SRPBCC family protein [Asticcacaulis solisilvae]|uniref:SRPBCC family protein n=1 Tax=Asticcacaulis solisilvae TaxID=1217274 RepID=UPI003FD792B9